MELNNNEDDNLGRNPLINNNNNNENANENNNINNIINNNNINEENNNFLLQYSQFSFSFTLIFIINITIYILSFYNEFDISKYFFDIEPILDHSQYYRFITRYFVHFGVCHLFLEFYITMNLCNYFENMFGTLFTIAFILISMIIDSIVQLCFYLLLSYLSNSLNVVDGASLNYEGGLTPVLFTLNTFFYLFEHDYLNEYNIFLFVLGKGKYSSFTMLVILYFFTPNRTFMGNLSGILGAYFIKNMLCCFLPRIRWILEFEDVFGLNTKKSGMFYRYVTNKNIMMKNILNQIQSNSVREDMDIDSEIAKDEDENGRQINNGDNNDNNEMQQSVIEMSSLSINNNNNNNNINNHGNGNINN